MDLDAPLQPAARKQKRRQAGLPAAAPPAAGLLPLGVKLTGDAPHARRVYIKAHDDDGAGIDGGGGGRTPRRAAAPPATALFVAGLPLTWRPVGDVVAALFAQFGPVTAVAVHPDQARRRRRGTSRGGRGVQGWGLGDRLLRAGRGAGHQTP